MANLVGLSGLARGSDPGAGRPFNEVDNLILAELSYPGLRRHRPRCRESGRAESRCYQAAAERFFARPAGGADH